MHRRYAATMMATSKWSTLFVEQHPPVVVPLPGPQFPRLLALPSAVVRRVIDDEKPANDPLVSVPAASLTAKRLGITFISLLPVSCARHRS